MLQAFRKPSFTYEYDAFVFSFCLFRSLSTAPNGRPLEGAHEYAGVILLLTVL